MTKVLKVIGFANGEPCPIQGQYIKTFDFDAAGGRGFGTFTDKPNKAKQFADAVSALRFWRQQSKTMPTRPDGKPNRPLTCTTIEVVTLKQPGE